MDNSLKLKLSLDTLTLQTKPSRRSKPRPYMWNIFFKVDSTTVKINDDFTLEGVGQFKYTPGNHGNLSEHPATAQKPILIPSVEGEWITNLVPFKVPIFDSYFPGLIGVVTVVLLQGNVSAQGVRAGHEKLNQVVAAAIDQSIAEFDPKKLNLLHAEQSVREYFERRVKKFTGGIMNSVESAVRNAQSVFQNLWSLANRDDLIGFQAWDFNNADLERHHGKIQFSQHWPHKRYGHWEVHGSLVTLETDNPAKPQ